MQRKFWGWFYFRYFGLFKARDQSQSSIDLPRGCVNVFMQSALYHLRNMHPATNWTVIIICCVTVHLAVCYA